ncbi:hypothetical protein F4821DRAFT_2856 [Hypoxylon rubiginosum]|uniref:Uncharacterized protein n=1 Tax=Hypoxylon rubiginosum TaxID=110542 RepID=A0ACC0DM84_9PEZI|nr:hypothetical protein F4821DRAFT_2856 [Hypoxylon rubiginosum]
MATITSQIKEAAPRNSELLAILSETDHAPPALEHQKHYISDLNNELSTAQKRIAALDKQRVKEFKEHKKYRDSVMKRFLYRVGGKTDRFEARAEKEEQEYFAVLQEERQAKEQEENLKSLRSKALEAQSDLEADVGRHAEAQQQLDSLYDSIFQGPTPSFPDEDCSERNAEDALQAYHNSRVAMETELQVVHLLTEAKGRLFSALNYIEDALGHSRMDMFGGGTFTDMMERNCLDNAEVQIRQMFSLVRQAQRMSPKVQDLPDVNIPHGNLMSDVFFDNIFTDMAFHEKIKDSRVRLYRSRDVLLDQFAQAQARYNQVEQETNVYAAALRTAREDLQRARERIFQRIANSSENAQVTSTDGGGNTDDPPPY